MRCGDLLMAVEAQIDVGRYNRSVTPREDTGALEGFRSEIINQCKQAILEHAGSW